MTKKKEKLLIIDGNALIHRSFHALPPTMTTKDGQMTNAVFGFATVLIKAIKEFKPEYVVLTLDKKGPTFRHKQFDGYKAHRVKAPDELYEQIPKVKKLVEAFAIPIFEQSGFEADDLIGTISKITSHEGGLENIIVTGDMDTMQLIDDNTKVYTMSRGISESVLYDEVAVRAKYGLTVDQMIDYKALRGDPSDNIPGVKGIGEKTAVDLLSKFKTLDGVYKNIESAEIKDRIRDLLKEYKDNAYMSRDLATIKRDVDLKFDLEKARFNTFDINKVGEVLSELEFKSLLPRIKDLVKESKAEAIASATNKFTRNQELFNYTLVDDEKIFKKFISELKKQKSFTFDTETTGFDPLNCSLLGVSFAWKKGEAYFVDFKGRLDAPENAQAKQASLFGTGEAKKSASPWLDDIKKVMEDGKFGKSAHNAKFDMRVLWSYGIDTKNIAIDTMIASYLLSPGTRQHNLDVVTFAEFGFEKISKNDLLGKGRDKVSFGEVDTGKLSLYSCEDADFTNQLALKLTDEIKAQKIDKLFNEIEMPLMPILAKMENAGVIINDKFLHKFSEELSGSLTAIEKKIYKQAGMEFNIRSTKQLKEVLFEKLEISTSGIGKTKTGFSTSADELVKLKDLHPIIPLIREHRELTKLLTTYVDTLPALVNKNTGRLHTSFNQTVTATGRLSSTDPNLQNIPIKTELGKKIRRAFIAEKGYKLVGLDYSQIELRLAAHMSGDEKMIEAFNKELDIHAATAAEINKVKLADVTSKMRREAKAVNFGILYGQGPHGLSQTADISYVEAREFIEKYFASFKSIKSYIKEAIDDARKKGYAETLFSRRRYLPELDSSVAMVRKGAERMAINTPLQGTSADMIKIAMIKIDVLLEEYKKKVGITNTWQAGPVRMILQVHDELIFEVREDLVDEVVSAVKKIMEEVIKLKVPVKVDSAVGDNWGEI